MLILGMTLAQWAVIIPRIIIVLKFFAALFIGYRVLNGGNSFIAAKRLLDLIPKPHKMTADEEKLWFDKAKGFD